MASEGYGLDVLVNDPNADVREAARGMKPGSAHEEIDGGYLAREPLDDILEFLLNV